MSSSVVEVGGDCAGLINRKIQRRSGTGYLDAALAGAWANQEIVRVIVNEGLQRPADSLGKESSKGEMRKLDAVAWHVAEYDGLNGSLCLVRNTDDGQANPSVAARLAPSNVPVVSTPVVAPPVVRFADQYTVVAADVQQIQSTGSVYSRSRSVRDAALTRASGACELCGQRGFVTQSGTIYLETHHVQPLSEGGTDSEDNVAALCPNDHRRAHHSAEAAEIREHLRATLAEIYSMEVGRAA